MNTIEFGKYGNLELSFDPSAPPPYRNIRANCHHRLIVVEGSGEESKIFPPKEVVLANVLQISEQYIQRVLAQLLQMRQSQAQAGPDANDTDTAPELKDNQPDGRNSNKRSTATEPAAAPAPQAATAATDAPAPSATGVDPTMFVAAQGVLDELNRRKWFGFIAARFDELSGTYNAAREKIADKKMDPNLLWVVESLDSSHVVLLRQIWADVMPLAVVAKQAEHPELPERIIAMCVAAALDLYFQNIYQVVSLYARAFRQEMDGLYPVLKGLKAFIASCYKLFETGDPSGCHNCLPKLKSRIFRAGGRFLLLAGDDGPATISGGQELLKGPIGVHLGLVPFDELDILLFELPIFGHENYHNEFWDVERLPEETAEKVYNAVQAAAENVGAFQFSTDHVLVGEHKVPILKFLTMAFLQELPEIAADLPGGVMFSGPAFWKAVLQLFIALNSDEKGVLQTEEGLRTGSTFELVPQPSGSVRLQLETHTPDFPRGFVLACAYDAIGFHKDADECRARTSQANGFQHPEFIEWKNPQVDWSIKVRMSDFIQLVPVVVNSILFDKMDALGGLSNADIVNWTVAREEKVQILVKLLEQLFLTGKTSVPADLGDVYPHYFGAALTHVYWDLIAKGWKPAEIFKRLSAPALELMLAFDAKAKEDAAKKVAAPMPAAG